MATAPTALPAARSLTLSAMASAIDSSCIGAVSSPPDPTSKRTRIDPSCAEAQPGPGDQIERGLSAAAEGLSVAYRRRQIARRGVEVAVDGVSAGMKDLGVTLDRNHATFHLAEGVGDLLQLDRDDAHKDH